MTISLRFRKWTFRFSFLAPLFFWIYKIFWGDLGAEPIATLNWQTGYVTLVFFLVNWLLGFLIAQKMLDFVFPRWIFSERRALGMATGFYAILHFMTYLGKESFLQKAWEQMVTKTYLSFATLALIILILQLLTSNDLSVRRLRHKNWKRLHRLVHLAAFFIAAHVFLIEKGNIPLLVALIIPLSILQIYRFLRKSLLANSQKLD